ncbi:unnamed protein product [Paramecium sonneborni]|uniref:ATPase AAA-type core domain-containing protein n=1 Tax=Paramecium sonneborni TaxID=65129 RepID=A0A8S1P0H2_9CILI|nr:unnamed protein product [Paramecium sonneborni]
MQRFLVKVWQLTLQQDRQFFLPLTGLLNASQLKPAELIRVNKDGYMLYEKIPTEYDARVKTMEVDEKPQEGYNDIDGLDKQIEELREAIVLPIVHKERFKNIGNRPPKGVLMYGPPGTGKTMMARACVAQTKATFLKLAGPQLVQMFMELKWLGMYFNWLKKKHLLLYLLMNRCYWNQKI